MKKSIAYILGLSLLFFSGIGLSADLSDTKSLSQATPPDQTLKDNSMVNQQITDALKDHKKISPQVIDE